MESHNHWPKCNKLLIDNNPLFKIKFFLLKLVFYFNLNSCSTDLLFKKIDLFFAYSKSQASFVAWATILLFYKSQN